MSGVFPRCWLAGYFVVVGVCNLVCEFKDAMQAASRRAERKVTQRGLAEAAGESYEKSGDVATKCDQPKSSPCRT